MRKGLIAAVIVSLLVAATVTSARALGCELDVGTPLRDGCLFTITGSDTPDPNDGYGVTNADGVPMWDFVRDKDLQAIGYPISHRWDGGPFTLQAFQKVILQWDPVAGRMNYYNTLDVLADVYPQVELPNIPAHQALEADLGADFGAVIRNHLAILDQNAKIKERFLVEPDWLNLYGLPIRYEARDVDGNPEGLQVLRTQRTVFEVWNVPAPGTTVGVVNLQNVPDKVKRLSNVIIPDAAKILADAPDPEITAAIETLPWVADGTTPVEQDTITNLERIALASDELFWRLIRDMHVSGVRDQPTEHTLPIIELLATITELAWIQDGISDHEYRLSRTLYDTASRLPHFTRALVHKPWMKDEVTPEELSSAHDLIDLAASDVNIAYRILAMPFMDTVEGFDASAIHSLTRINNSDRSTFLRIISHPHLRDGIRNDHASIITVLWDVMNRKPSLINTLLDPSKGMVEQRSIVLPRTGNVLLAIIRTRYGSPRTMDYLERAVRAAEEIMAEPFPTRSVALLISDIVAPWGGLFLYSHFTIRTGYDDLSHYLSDYAERTVMHEVAHYYWHVCPSWLCEGGAEYFEIRSGLLGSGAMREIAHECGGTIIRDVTSGWHRCHYFLGARLFFDLYYSLGEELFTGGFRRLYHSIRGDGEVPDDCGDVEIGLCYVRFAFTVDTTPEAAAVAETFISRWYYGDDA